MNDEAIIKAMLWLAIAWMLLTAFAADARSRTPVRAFMHANACPSSGKIATKCEGWVVDHIIPLCAGGADAPSNMQWQPIDVSHVKDQDEMRLCAWIRAARKEQ
jgi:hypothetical protein